MAPPWHRYGATARAPSTEKVKKDNARPSAAFALNQFSR
jgi:hypothetical protein